MRTGQDRSPRRLLASVLLALALASAAGQAAASDPEAGDASPAGAASAEPEVKAAADASPAGPAEASPAAGMPGDKASPPAPRAASWVTLDPQTGEPRPERFSPRLEDWLSRRSDDLFEEALPAGGFAVDLKGRFRSLTVVEVGEDSEIVSRCLDRVPQDSRGEKVPEHSDAGGHAEHAHE